MGVWWAIIISTTARRMSSCSSGMAQMAAAAPRAVHRGGGTRRVMQMDSWQELANPRDLTKIFQTPEYAAWRSLRDSEDSRYLGLGDAALSVAHAVWGEDRTRSRNSSSRRTPTGADHSKYTWATQRTPWASNINRVIQAIRLVLAHSRRRVGRHGGGIARAHLPD